MELPKSLVEMYKTGITHDLEGKERAATGTILEPEAEILMQMVVDTKAKNSLETGVAYGASALAMCEALNLHSDESAKHYGVDPCQYSDHGGAALAALKKDDLDHRFELLEGPSHLMLPELVKKEIVIDCAFVDGWHTFDYTLLDFFLIDKLLRPGGLVAFHDMALVSKQKVLGYILTHRDYEIASEYRVKGNESRMTTLKIFLWRLYRRPSLLFSWYHWTYQLKNSSGLIVLRKKRDFEPEYNFFKNF